MTTFEQELDAIRAIYGALKPFEIYQRDRLLRMVQERLARERSPERLSTIFRQETGTDIETLPPDVCRAFGIEHIELEAPPAA